MLFEKPDKARIRLGRILSFVVLCVATVFILIKLVMVFPADLAQLEHAAWTNDEARLQLKLLLAHVVLLILFLSWSLVSLGAPRRGYPWQVLLTDQTVRVQYVGFRSWAQEFPLFELERLEILEGNTALSFKLKVHLHNYRKYLIAVGRETELEILKVMIETKRKKVLEA